MKKKEKQVSKYTSGTHHIPGSSSKKQNAKKSSIKRPVVMILAGGSGKRFWPYSRVSRPKQLLAIYSQKTLLKETILRASSLTSKKNIFIGTNEKLKRAILKIHPEFPKNNFIIEPEAKNTAPIIALSALMIRKNFGERTLIVLSADHYIHPVNKFKNAISSAVKISERGFLVTLGIKPVRPDTGYGYLKRGDKLGIKNSYELKEFKEKPNSKTASQYLKDGRYFWNAGIFIFNTGTVLCEMEKHCPEILNPLKNFFPFKNKRELQKAFSSAPSESIDYALMEKSNKIALVKTDFHWDDVGSWLAFERFLKKDTYGNQSHSKRKRISKSGKAQTKFFFKNSENNLVIGEKELVCLLGVKDLIVVEDDNVTFVCSKKEIDNMKKLVGDIEGVSKFRRFL
jgi:mannose-1-phosphate guanylyltransferase